MGQRKFWLRKCGVVNATRMESHMSETDGINSELPDELDKPRKIVWFISDITGEYYFRIQGDNHLTIAASQGYTTKDAMFDTLDEYFDNWDVVEDEV